MAAQVTRRENWCVELSTPQIGCGCTRQGGAWTQVCLGAQKDLLFHVVRCKVEGHLGRRNTPTLVLPRITTTHCLVVVHSNFLICICRLRRIVGPVICDPFQRTETACPAAVPMMLRCFDTGRLCGWCINKSLQSYHALLAATQNQAIAQVLQLRPDLRYMKTL